MSMENEPEKKAHALMALLGVLIHSQNNPSPMSTFIDCARRRRAVNRVAHLQRFLRRQQESREDFEALLVNYSFHAVRRTVWVQQRSGAWWEQVNANWTDYEWQLNFKMRKTTFQQLCDILRPHLQRQMTTFRNPVPVEQRVALCIWRLSTNVGFQTISHLFGIGQSTAVTIANDVASAIVNKMLPLYIQTPSEEEFKLIIQGFRDKWGFPQCGGAIDQAHIGILAPNDRPADYYNSKGFYSVILQGVVDHRLRFWDINVGWPGKLSDATVFGNSSLYERGQSGMLFPHITEKFGGESVPVAILGNRAYPLLPWLMTPFPENQFTNPAQLTFNNHLNKARITAKRAFGRLKERWQCLGKRCDCNINNINTVISACCVLHNFCEENSEDCDCTDVQEDNIEEKECNDFCRTTALHTSRDALCAYFASL